MIYVDNDSVKTLAELDLLDLLCPALEVEHDEMSVFTLRSVAESLGRKVVSERVWSRIAVFLDETGFVSEHLFGAAFASIKDLPNMDAEAALFACCANDPGTRTVTGDLKSIRTLALEASEAIFQALQGRVVSTEQCLLRILDLIDFEEVHNGWKDSPCQHRFFSTLIGMDEVGVRAAIKQRLNDLDPRMKTLIGWP